MARDFTLIRLQDLTGTSGTGTVATGRVEKDGTASMRWTVPARLADGTVRIIPTITHYTRWHDVVLLHGHGGRTILEWTDTGERVSDWDILRESHGDAV